MSQDVGALVSLSGSSDDSAWTAKQTEITSSLPPRDAEGRQEIDWSYGPVKILGYVDTSTFEIGVSVDIVGINTGNMYGNMKDGVSLKVDFFVAKGSIKFYLKNGNELWVHLDIKITFDGSFSGDYKIRSI